MFHTPIDLGFEWDQTIIVFRMAHFQWCISPNYQFYLPEIFGSDVRHPAGLWQITGASTARPLFLSGRQWRGAHVCTGRQVPLPWKIKFWGCFEMIVELGLKLELPTKVDIQNVGVTTHKVLSHCHFPSGVRTHVSCHQTGHCAGAPDTPMKIHHVSRLNKPERQQKGQVRWSFRNIKWWGLCGTKLIRKGETIPVRAWDADKINGCCSNCSVNEIFSTGWMPSIQILSLIPINDIGGYGPRTGQFGKHARKWTVEWSTFEISFSLFSLKQHMYHPTGSQ